MQAKTLCAIYTRVSTDNQAEIEFNSCEAQKERIEHFIKSQEGFSLYNVYNDEGYSGKDLNRPALQSMLSDIAKGYINCVITYKMDRLTRSPRDFYQLIELFDKYKVDYISVTERFDTSTPSGKLLRNIMLDFAQFERDLASERTKDKLIQRVQKGMWNGGIAPLGYKSIGKKLTKIENEEKIIRETFFKMEETKSIAKVYEYLKSKEYKDRNGKTITKNKIVYILQNIIYTGKLKYAGKIYQGNHEPIISEELFNKVQKHFKAKQRKWRQYKTFLFAGLVRCANCNRSMSPCFSTKKSKTKKIERYYYYRCLNTFKHNWNACDIKHVSANRLENYVMDSLNRMSLDRHYLYSSSLDRDTRNGHGKNGLWAESEQELFQKYLKDFLFAAEKISGTGKCHFIKNYVENVIYSKETIQVNIYWGTNVYNGEGRLEDAMEKSHTRPHIDCDKSIYSNRIGDIENGLNCSEDAGGMGDDPRRSAEGRGAEGVYPVRSRTQTQASATSNGVNRRSGSVGGIFPSEARSAERGIEIKKNNSFNRFEKLNWLLLEHTKQIFRAHYNTKTYQTFRGKYCISVVENN